MTEKTITINGYKIGIDTDLDVPVLIEEYEGQAFILANSHKHELRQASINAIYAKYRELKELANGKNIVEDPFETDKFPGASLSRSSLLISREKSRTMSIQYNQDDEITYLVISDTSYRKLRYYSLHENSINGAIQMFEAGIEGDEIIE